MKREKYLLIVEKLVKRSGKKLPPVSKLKECERKQLSDSYNSFIRSMLLNEPH